MVTKKLFQKLVRDTLCGQQSALGRHLGAPSAKKAQSVVPLPSHIAETNDSGTFALAEG